MRSFEELDRVNHVWIYRTQLEVQANADSREYLMTQAALGCTQAGVWVLGWAVLVTSGLVMWLWAYGVLPTFIFITEADRWGGAGLSDLMTLKCHHLLRCLNNSDETITLLTIIMDYWTNQRKLSQTCAWTWSTEVFKVTWMKWNRTRCFWWGSSLYFIITALLIENNNYNLAFWGTCNTINKSLEIFMNKIN